MSRSFLHRALWIIAFLGGTILLASVVGIAFDFPLTAVVVEILLLGAALLLIVWALVRLLRWFLWRVGRRLAFSYFLIGFIPIPMVLLLIFLGAYLLGGYFLGHLYRDAASSIEEDLLGAANHQFAAFQAGRAAAATRDGELLFAYYRNGTRVAGDTRLPLDWPSWLEDRVRLDGVNSREGLFSFVTFDDGPPTMGAVAGSGRQGVLAVLDGAVEKELAARSDVWVSLLRAEDPEKQGLVRLDFLGRELVLQPFAGRPKSEARDAFFDLADDTRPPFRHRPLVWWGELTGPLQRIEDGAIVSEYLAASLNGTPTTIRRHLMSGSAEVDTTVWASLIAISGVLLSIYSVAFMMAFFMIFTLSRAVNRLSRATDAVRRGEFSVRIPVRRADQIGELQLSFNEMAAGLDRSVVAIAQKEVLEKELRIARDLQQSLLPTDIPSSDQVDFATVFEPSAAIGGDYFDILRLDQNRLVVVIADVSGHGLPTGLRMAMLKAALVILVEERKPPEEIFRRLSAMVRTEGVRHFFVTATIAIVDLEQGTLELTNAGHPPTYLVRNTEVVEISLPGNPLGALGEQYGHQILRLEPGDVAVWLSDGIIESTDGSGEPFGYERLQEALAGPGESAAAVRDRLLAAASLHAGTRPTQDDKTLVAMRYSPATE